jgi:hypothetical protein
MHVLVLIIKHMKLIGVIFIAYVTMKITHIELFTCYMTFVCV